MITITAILKTKSGHEKTMKDGLLRVAENVQKSEPETVGFFISMVSPTSVNSGISSVRPVINISFSIFSQINLPEP